MEPEGVTVATLETPDGLMAALDATRPAALLMDVNLGGHDGIALTRGLRQDAAWRDLPIVLFSGDTDAARREAAYAAGADDFLAKPIVADELRRRLLAQLEARRRTRLGEACHPGTGLALPSRTVREAARGLEAAAARGAPAVLAVVRAAGDAPRGGRAAAWLQELERLGHALREPGGTVGMLEDDALLVVAPGDAATLARRLEDLAAERGTDAPAWHAGLAALDAGHRTLDALRRGADEAHAAAAAAGEVAHIWRPGDDGVPPDVVVIEDDRALADMVTFALRSAGFTHRAFADGREALDALLAMRTGGRRVVVICDVDLPGLDGHALHERIRTARPGAFLFVFASSHASEAEQLRALGAGALDWLTKPLSVRVLVAKARHWVAIAAAGRA
jgi:DNA-binding response OmpR family regulator